MNTHGLTDLGYKILLDRYALKDSSRQNISVGQTVIITVDKHSNQREIGIIEAIDEQGRLDVRLQDDSLYLRKPIDVDVVLESTPQQIWQRVAKGAAAVEKEILQPIYEKVFYELLEDFKFVPAGRILTALGTDQQLTLFNCFVLPCPHDSRQGIMKTLLDMTEIMSRGGGVGINVSSLRPKRAYVKGVNGRSSGAVSWGALYSFVTGLIEQGGCFSEDTRISTDKGLIQAKELYQRMLAGESFEAQTHVGYKRIIDKFDNGLQQLYRIETSRGDEISVTKTHQMGMFDELGQIILKTVDSLEVGDNILFSIDQGSNLNIFPVQITEITPTEIAETYDFEVEDVHMLTGNGFYTSNSRRGALLIALSDWHPDVLDFINSKREAGKITNANISVAISDRFMEAVKNDEMWTLRFPDTQYDKYNREWDGILTKWEAKGYPVIEYQTLPARELWRTLIESAWSSAEPGLLFLERAQKYSNSHYFNEIICSNPCAEQKLPANAVCNLGAINLAKFYNEEFGVVDLVALDRCVRQATRFLDNVIDATPYFLEETYVQQMGERRIGLNTMGIAELLLKMGIRYGSQESLDMIDIIYGVIQTASYETSVALAREKGPFLNFSVELLESGYAKTLSPELRHDIAEYGLRNVTLLTQAPNGTIGTMVNTSTGIEPFFSWTYFRKSRLGTHEEHVELVSEWFEKNPGQPLPDYFVTAMELSPEEHVGVQAQIQKYIDSSISKTVNVPESYTVEDTMKLYQLMYDMGCKGGTIYRDNSRDEQVLILKQAEIIHFCPECSEQSLVKESGCETCSTCGYSACSA